MPKAAPRRRRHKNRRAGTWKGIAREIASIRSNPAWVTLRPRHLTASGTSIQPILAAPRNNIPLNRVRSFIYTTGSSIGTYREVLGIQFCTWGCLLRGRKLETARCSVHWGRVMGAPLPVGIVQEHRPQLFHDIDRWIWLARLTYQYFLGVFIGLITVIRAASAIHHQREDSGLNALSLFPGS